MIRLKLRSEQVAIHQQYRVRFICDPTKSDKAILATPPHKSLDTSRQGCTVTRGDLAQQTQEHRSVIRCDVEVLRVKGDPDCPT